MRSTALRLSGRVRALAVVAAIAVAVTAKGAVAVAQDAGVARPTSRSVHTVCDLHLLQPAEVAHAFGVKNAKVVITIATSRICVFALPDPSHVGGNLMNLGFSNPARLDWGRTGVGDDSIPALLSDGSSYGRAPYSPSYCGETTLNLGEQAVASSCTAGHNGGDIGAVAALAVIKNEAKRVGFSLFLGNQMGASPGEARDLPTIENGLVNLAKIVLRRAGGPPGRSAAPTTTVPTQATSPGSTLTPGPDLAAMRQVALANSQYGPGDTGNGSVGCAGYAVNAAQISMVDPTWAVLGWGGGADNTGVPCQGAWVVLHSINGSWTVVGGGTGNVTCHLTPPMPDAVVDEFNVAVQLGGTHASQC